MTLYELVTVVNRSTVVKFMIEDDQGVELKASQWGEKAIECGSVNGHAVVDYVTVGDRKLFVYLLGEGE